MRRRPIGCLTNARLSFDNDDTGEIGHGQNGLLEFFVSTNELRGRGSTGHSFLCHEGSVEPRRLFGDGRTEVELQRPPQISQHAQSRTWLSGCLKEFSGQAGHRLVLGVVGERRQAEPERSVDLSLIAEGRRALHGQAKARQLGQVNLGECGRRIGQRGEGLAPPPRERGLYCFQARWIVGAGTVGDSCERLDVEVCRRNRQAIAVGCSVDGDTTLEGLKRGACSRHRHEESVLGTGRFLGPDPLAQLVVRHCLAGSNRQCRHEHCHHGTHDEGESGPRIEEHRRAENPEARPGWSVGRSRHGNDEYRFVVVLYSRSSLTHARRTSGRSS